MKIFTHIVLGLTVLLWLVCCGGCVRDFISFPIGCDVPLSGDFWLYAPPGIGYLIAIPFAWGSVVLAAKESIKAKGAAGVGAVLVLILDAFSSLWFVYVLR